MANITGRNDTPLNNFTFVNVEIAPASLILTLKLVAAWIIITNGLILVCLMFNRRALEHFVNLQILSMSATDFLLGLSFVPVIQSFQNIRSFPTFWPCFTVISLYTIAQHATIHHALAICVYRLIKIKGLNVSSEREPRKMFKKLCLHIIIPWSESILYVGTVSLMFAKHNKNIRVCSLNELFEDSYIDFMIVCLFNTIAPHIAMDVIYVYILVFLKRRWRRINTIRSSGGTIREDTAQATSSKSTEDTAESKQNEKEPESTKKPPGDLFITSGRQFPDTKLKPGHGNEKRNPSRSSNVTNIPSKAKLEEERYVLITIGLLLLVLNVFMTPVSLIAIAELFATSPLSRQVKFTMVIFPLINSIINPIIYMFRIKPLRTVIGNTWRKIFEKLC